MSTRRDRTVVKTAIFKMGAAIDYEPRPVQKVIGYIGTSCRVCLLFSCFIVGLKRKSWLWLAQDDSFRL